MTEHTTSFYLLIQTTTSNTELPDPGCALVSLSSAYVVEMSGRVATACAGQSVIRYDDRSPDLCDFTVDYSWPDFVRGAYQFEPDLRQFAVVAAEALPRLTRSDIRAQLSTLMVNSLGQVQWSGERGDVKVTTAWINWADVQAALHALDVSMACDDLINDLSPLLCEP